MKIHNLKFEPYISKDRLDNEIRRVATEINRDYGSAEEPPLIVITLSGALIFAADLVREFDFTTELAYVKCASYHDKMESSGEILFELGLTLPAKGRDVIVIEDIVDTGNTYESLQKYLLEDGAKSVKIATMLLKHSVYKKSLPIDYVAMEVDDVFVVGAGLDYNQMGRNLKGIYRLAADNK